MHFDPTAIDGVLVVRTDPVEDDRGWFARAWCQDEFAEAGLEGLTSQASLSMNRRRHTLRGMHWQKAPSREAKLVRPVRGAIFDVAVDLREGSPTHGSWVGVELRADEHTALYLPPQCAHGYLTLDDDTLVLYQMSAPYEPELSVGFHHDDPEVGISWPASPVVMSDRDAALPRLADALDG